MSQRIFPTTYQQIHLKTPNPFTVRPIQTPFRTNDLLLTDHESRIRAFISPIDIGLMEGSTYTSPIHLQPGWKWK